MPQRLSKVTDIVLLLLILALAAYLRLYNITDNPGWFSDEGSNLDIAQHIVHGQMQYMALGQSTLLVSRMPIFEGLLALLLSAFGGGITTLRTLTGVLGVISVGLLYIVVRRLGKHLSILALLAALLLAIFPQAVLYSCFGFSYNLLTALLLLALIGLLEHISAHRRAGLLLAAVAFGVGTISDLWMLSMIPVFVIVVAFSHPRDLLWSLPALAAPFAIYSALMLLTVPNAFLYDLRFVLFRVSNLSLFDQVQNVALNYTTLIAQDGWMLAGVLGIFLLHPTRLRLITIVCFFLPLIFIGRTVALYSLSLYYMIPLLPLIALGVAALVYYGTIYLWQMFREDFQSSIEQIRLPERWQRSIQSVIAVSLIIALVVTPFVISLSLTINNVRNGFPTAIDPFLIRVSDAIQVAQFINTHARSDDLVIASPAIAWQFQTRTADFQMAIAATGRATPHFPADIPTPRFVFDPRFEHARYVVIDNLWLNWGAVNVPGVSEMMRKVETWPLVFESGAIRVYENHALLI